MPVNESISIAEFASLFGFEPESVAAAVEKQRSRSAARKEFFTIPELAERWQCSRAQVYTLLNASAVKVLNIGQGKKRSKTRIPAESVARIEKLRTEKMS